MKINNPILIESKCIFKLFFFTILKEVYNIDKEIQIESASSYIGYWNVVRTFKKIKYRITIKNQKNKDRYERSKENTGRI